MNFSIERNDSFRFYMIHFLQVYDSLYSSCSSNIQQQIACLLHTDMPNSTLECVTVHKQHSRQDCGLFSLAYAAALCYNEQPGNYVFNQAKLPWHLISCPENKMFSMFLFISYCFQAMNIHYNKKSFLHVENATTTRYHYDLLQPLQRQLLW